MGNHGAGDTFRGSVTLGKKPGWAPSVCPSRQVRGQVGFQMAGRWVLLQGQRGREADKITSPQAGISYRAKE